MSLMQLPHMNGPSTVDQQATSMSMRTNSSGSDVVVIKPPTTIDMSMGLMMSSMSLENLGLDMSLEEAVTKVRELAKENSNLREDAQKNNQTMKQQYQTLSDWKARWEQERDDVKKRHDQAKTVVTQLREQLGNKCEEIKQLQLEIAQSEENQPQQFSQSSKAELLTLEQTKSDLEKKCAIYTDQIQILVEELEEIKTAREDQTTEMDKYVRIVHQNEQKINQVEHSNKMLENEIKTLKRLGEENVKLQEEKKELVTENQKLKTDIEMLRSPPKTTEFMDLSYAEMKSGFVHVGVIEQGIEVSDSIPFTDDELVTKVNPESKSNFPNVRCAAKPNYNEYHVSESDPLKLNKESDKVGLQQETAMSDLLAQLQEERTKTSNLIAENQTKMQEMEALHKKVHHTEELLAESDYKLNMAVSKKKVENNREIESLRMHLDHVKRELEQSKSLSASRTSLDSQPLVSAAEEEQKNLRVQVTSLVSELQEANDRQKSMENLYEKQKERIQSMETQMQGLTDDLEIQRNKDDELIETLRVTINHLETQLSSERREKANNDKSIQKMSHDYGLVVQHYHEAAKRAEILQKQLQEQQRTPAFSANQKQQYEERIDNLTAQLITAEESMQERSKKLVATDQERNKLQRQLEALSAEIDLVAVHKAQAEVYKSDFSQERESREKAQGDILTLKEEINQLNIRNQQLQEEMDHMSQNQIAQMQIRHGNATPNMGRLSPYGNMGAFNYAREPSDGGRLGQNPPQGGYYGSGIPNIQPRGPPIPAEQEEDIYECPKCQEQFPDLDTLQLHVLDCIH